MRSLSAFNIIFFSLEVGQRAGSKAQPTATGLGRHTHWMGEDLPSARQRLAEQMALASPTRSPAARHPTRTAHHSRKPKAGLVTAIVQEREGGSLVGCSRR